jgi:hypothetical protein
MNQKPRIRAFWEARKETHRECVARTLRFLEAISKDPSLGKWFIPGKSRKESNRPQELSMEAIGKRTKPIWKPIRGIPFPNSTDLLGFDFAVWNCNDEASAGILVHCGSYDPDQKNDVLLNLPKQPFPGDEASQERFKRLLNILAEVWDPDFALVTTDERFDQAFKDYETGAASTSEWEQCHFNSAWLFYKRDQPIVVNSET